MRGREQEISLDPTPVFVVKVGELATIPVDTLTPEREPDRASQGQLRKRCLRFVGEGLKLDACPAERQFGSLDPNEAHLTSVIEHQRVPVDDLGDLGRPARDQGVVGEGGSARNQQYLHGDSAQPHAGTISPGAESIMLICPVPLPKMPGR